MDDRTISESDLSKKAFEYDELAYDASIHGNVDGEARYKKLAHDMRMARSIIFPDYTY